MGIGKKRGKYTQIPPEAKEPTSASELVSDSETSVESFLSAGPDSDSDPRQNSSEQTRHSHDADTHSLVQSPHGRHTVEGMSSTLSEHSPRSDQQGQPTHNHDLELQSSTLPPHLSRSDRVKNVINYLFPFKQTYERLNNGWNMGRMQSNAPGRFVGQGTDGVFRNLMAKPDTESIRLGQEQHPPTYEEAAADSSPEYWEATMISPMYEDEVFVQGLPVGNLANFVWNILVTVAFQLVGFILCYLLHTSHAAKHGTRAGLGITLIMYGYNAVPENLGRPDRIPTRYEPSDPNSIDISKSSSIKTGGAVDTYSSGFVQKSDSSNVHGGMSSPVLAYMMIALGILVFVKSIVDFLLIKREERKILAPQAQEEFHTTTEPVETPPPL